MNKNIIIIMLVALLGVVGYLAFFSENETTDVSDSKGTSQQDNKKQEFSNSEVLDYSGKGLTEFPKEILSKTSAKELDISKNALTGALPAEIKDLTSLEVLNVSNNNMTGIPAEIGQMSSLRVINYQNNNITGMPFELGNLSNLELLDLRGNNVAVQDLATIRQSLPSSTEILVD